MLKNAICGIPEAKLRWSHGIPDENTVKYPVAVKFEKDVPWQKRWNTHHPSTQIAKYMIPTRYVFLPEILSDSKTETIKIKKLLSPTQPKVTRKGELPWKLLAFKNEHWHAYLTDMTIQEYQCHHLYELPFIRNTTKAQTTMLHGTKYPLLNSHQSFSRGMNLWGHGWWGHWMHLKTTCNDGMSTTTKMLNKTLNPIKLSSFNQEWMSKT